MSIFILVLADLRFDADPFHLFVFFNSSDSIQHDIINTTIPSSLLVTFVI